jgi:hypothetical protein
MVLQIKEPETIRLIEELSRRTGERAEMVVRVAVQERLAGMRTPEEEAARRAEVYALVHEIATSIKESGVPLEDPGDFLYGEDGLPQ